VIENLLDNAAKYSGAGDPLKVTACVHGGCCTLRVVDRGAGIAPDERERVFERFYRARDSAGHASGTGLGLTICRGLVEALDGSIAITAGADGIGTCVEIVLPLAAVGAETGGR
jgi:two-component system sensor histidine kinase KdpD